MSYSFETKTGRGTEKICVLYEMDTDGEVYDLEIMHYGTGSDLSGYISEEQFERICDECSAHYEKAAKENNDDLKINNYLAGVEQ